MTKMILLGLTLCVLALLTFSRRFKLFELRGFAYWRGTRRTFGFWAALGQLSPLANTLRFWRQIFFRAAYVLLLFAFFSAATSWAQSPPTPTMQPTVISDSPPSATSSTGNGILDQAKLFLSQTDRGLGTWTTTNGAAKTFDLSIGACFENNVNADGIINGDYAIYKHVVVDGFARIWNSSSTIKSIGIGPGFELPIGDLKVGAYLDGVWRFDDSCAAVEPALALKNGVGKNAYLGLRLATDFEFSRRGGDGQKPYVATFFGINF